MATAPIDISMKSIKGKCNQFCLYSSKYTPTSSIGTNQGNYISLTYDNGSTNPVVYNRQNYVVEQMRLYFPSLHTFGGNKMAGEFVIIHTPVMGGDALIVCVPIKPTGIQSASAMMIAKTVQTISKKAPNSGETVQVFTKLDLSKLMPKAPYFSYVGTLPFPPSTGKVNFIVFNVTNGAFDVDPNVLNGLNGVITPHTIQTIQRTVRSHDGNVFYNAKGPTAMSQENEIYIECAPTGSSDEEITVGEKEESGEGDVDIAAFFKSDAGIIIIQILMATLIAFIMIYAVHKVFALTNIRITKMQSALQ